MRKDNRLERDPDYNRKRRKGTGLIHLEICKECGYRIPEEIDVEIGKQIPCSEYHTRCVRCHWPVANTMINFQGLCYKCMNGYERRAYNRKSGRRLYGKVDGSIDPKDYIMNGRMKIHGDETKLLEERRNKTLEKKSYIENGHETASSSCSTISSKSTDREI